MCHNIHRQVGKCLRLLFGSEQILYNFLDQFFVFFSPFFPENSCLLWLKAAYGKQQIYIIVHCGFMTTSNSFHIVI